MITLQFRIWQPGSSARLISTVKEEAVTLVKRLTDKKEEVLAELVDEAKTKKIVTDPRALMKIRTDAWEKYWQRDENKVDDVVQALLQLPSTQAVWLRAEIANSGL